MNMSEQQHIYEALRSVGHTHNNMKLVQGRTQFEKARQIAKTLGFKTAARYMAIRGYSIECAVNVLLGLECRG